MTHHNSPRHAVCADRATLAAILPHRQRDHDGAGLGTVPSRPARSARPARPGRMEQAFLDGLPEHARLIRWQLRHRRFASLTRELETLRGLAHAVGYRDIATQSGRLLRERLRTAAWRSTHDPAAALRHLRADLSQLLQRCHAAYDPDRRNADALNWQAHTRQHPAIASSWSRTPRGSAA